MRFAAPGTPPRPLRRRHSARCSAPRLFPPLRRPGAGKGSARSRAASKSRCLSAARSKVIVERGRSGHASAYRIGSRMSVTEICARIDPSTYSTIECTVDCGCTVTLTWLGATSNSRQASITSSPLLSIVAESIVIRRPITHVGCFSACSGVMVSNCSSGVWRNGPPEAVSQIALTSA